MSTRSNNIQIIVEPQENDESKKHGSSRNGGHRASGGGPIGGVSDRRAARNRTPRNRDREMISGPNSDRRVHVSNIPYDFRWQELKDLFRDNVGDVTRVELFSGDCGTPRGSGIVEFRSAEIAEHAVQKMHRRNVSGRKLVVKRDVGGSGGRDRSARDNDYDTAPPHHFANTLLPLSFPGNNMNNGGGMGGATEGGVGATVLPHLAPPMSAPSLQHQLQQPGADTPLIPNTFGLSVAFLDSLGIGGPLVERVFVANLDYQVDSERLREVFSLAGSVVGVQLKTDKDGRSKGHGTIQFAHPVEAVQAISMLHNQVFMDRPMTVRMDRQNESDSSTTVNTKVLPSGLRSIGPGLGLDGAPLTHIVRRFSADPNSCGTPSAGPTANPVNSDPAHAPLQPPPSLPPPHDPRAPAHLGIMAPQHSVPPVVPSALQLTLPPTAPPSTAAQFPVTGTAASVQQAPPAGLDMSALMAMQGGMPPTGLAAAAAAQQTLSAPTGREHPHPHAILVRNLDPTCGAQRLRDKYSEIAPVSEVQLQAPGVALVQFERPEHAARALALTHGCRLDGHVIHVTPC